MSEYNLYVPNGSYLNTSTNTRITLTADCLKANGHDYSKSEVSYVAQLLNEKDSDKMMDISNVNGVLTLIRDGGSPNANKHNSLGPFIPAGSYQESSKNINVKIETECQTVGGSKELTNITYNAEDVQHVADISNDNGHLHFKSMNVLDVAKLKWLNTLDYEALKIGDTALIGVTADGTTKQIGPDSAYSQESFKGGILIKKTLLGPGYAVIGSASVMRIASAGAIGDIDAVDVSIFEAYAEADMEPLYAGAGLGFRLAGGSASIFDFDLGVGLSTGVGIKDNSVELKLAGTGVTVGQKISISVFNNSFGLDLVRTAHAVGYIGSQLSVAIAIVPGAFENAGISLVGEFKAMPKTFADAAKGVGSEAAKIPGAIAAAPGSMWDGIKKSVAGLGDLF